VSDQRTLIVIPVLMRPHRAQQVAASVAAATPEPHRVMFVANMGDTAEIEACESTGHPVLVMPYRHHPAAWRRNLGEWAKKINAAYWASDEPYIFCGADDLVFHDGWLSAALAEMRPGIGVVGTNDTANPAVVAGLHATHPLVARWYADRYGTVDQPGLVLHEGYAHEYVDNELVATAQARRAWAFAADSVVEHLHPNWGTAPRDPLYAQQQARMRYGRLLYQRRRALWEQEDLCQPSDTRT
jgi:hypothetical protein